MNYEMWKQSFSMCFAKTSRSNQSYRKQILQETNREVLNPGANKLQDARLDIHALGFCEQQISAFFDIQVCHPNADLYKESTPNQIYRLLENEKKRMYN
jgi:hypothetical protein